MCGTDGWLPFAARALPAVRAKRINSAFEERHVRPVQRLVARQEHDRRVPEVLVVIPLMLPEPLADVIALPDIDLPVVLLVGVVTQQHVHPRRVEPLLLRHPEISSSDMTPRPVQFDFSTTLTPSGSPDVTRIEMTYGEDIRLLLGR